MENETNEVEEQEEETSTDDVETSDNNEEQNPSNEEKTLRHQKDHWKKKYNDLKDAKEKKVEKESNKPNESNKPDYGEIAFLEQRKITNPDDQKAVKEEAERLKLPLTDVLGMKHIKQQLADSKAQRAVEKGMPKGRGDASSKTKADVDYWLNKGETPDDQDLAEKVINARMKKESDGNKFSDQLYTG